MWKEVKLPAPGSRVVVGLSGGVDSAVAALRLKEHGCEILGVTTRNFCEDDLPGGAASTERSCCSKEAVAAARELASDLGVSHHVLDLAEPFAKNVIVDFVAEYQSGQTPNPCVRCNRFVRYPFLLDFARTMGADFVATGHYARLVEHPESGRHVARAADEAKDQSYYLHGLSSAILKFCAFPLGGLHKSEVREQARRRGLPAAETPESQEICFVPGGDRTALVEGGMGSGEIVDRAGRVLGQHRGLAHYTVGQRRGLGLSANGTHYVMELRAQENRVVVGIEEDLLRDLLLCDQAWLRDPAGGAPGLVARTRSRHRGRPVGRLAFEKGRLEVQLQEVDRAPAPGQSLVLYRDGVVVGGGRIKESQCAS
jgi:tRNA-specific 2-thiouridylase